MEKKHYQLPAEALNKGLKECLTYFKQDKQAFKNWFTENFVPTKDENEELWYMFRCVVESSTWGASEYGGPIRVIDFRISSLRRLIPDSPWWDVIDDETEHKGINAVNCQDYALVRSFSSWFGCRLHHLIMSQGLCNVITLFSVVGIDTHILSFYSLRSFLQPIASLCNLPISPIRWRDRDFSWQDEEILKKGLYTTFLYDDRIQESDPDIPHSCFLFPNATNFHKHWETRRTEEGEWYNLPYGKDNAHNFVLQETDVVKTIVLLTCDFMEAWARNLDLNIENSKWFYNYEYPVMQSQRACDLSVDGLSFSRFIPSQKTFYHNSKHLSEPVRILLRLPDIDPQYGKFWHRQFPRKVYWTMKKNWTDSQIPPTELV